MAYEGLKGKLPDGLAGMSQRENRLLSRHDQYINAQGVTFEEQHIRKEAGALSLDTSGVAGAPTFSATLSSADGAWGGWLALFPASGGTPAVAGTAATAAPASGTSQAITVPVGGYAIGTLVVVSYGGADLPGAISGVTDTQGNTYTAITSAVPIGSSSFSETIRGYYSVLGVTLAAGNTITATFTFSVDIVIAVANYSNAIAPLSTATASSDPAAAVTVGPVSAATIPYLLVASVYNDGANTSTPGSSFTEHIELVGPPGSITVNYRVDTLATTTIAIHDWYSDFSQAGAGTVSVTAGSTTVTGVGTAFSSTPILGDYITIGSEKRRVSSVTSDLIANTTQVWATTAAGSAYTQRIGQRPIIATSGGTLYKGRYSSFSAGTFDLDAVTLKSGLSAAARPGKFVQGGKEAAALNRKLFYYNGVDPIQVLSGNSATTSDLTLPSSDWATVFNRPVNGTIHRNRHVAWGNLNFPHQVYFSDPDDHEDFTAANTDTARATILSTVGDRLMCGVSFNGVLWFWKFPRGVFYLDDTALSPPWTIFVKSEAVGCAQSPHAVLPMDDDVIFLAADGSFHLLSAVNTLGGTRDSDLSYALGISKWIRENINLERLDQVTSVWYPHKKVAYFGLPGIDQATNTVTVKFDFAGSGQTHPETGGTQPVKFSYSTRDTPDALGIIRDPDGIERPALGETGFVYLLDQTTRAKAGVLYTGTYQKPHLDFSHMGGELEYRRKVWDALELVMDPVSSGTLTIAVYVDGALRETLTFDPTVRRQRKTLHCGDGFMISFVGSESTLNGDFKILSHNVFFTLGNEDYSRAV